MSRTTRNKAHDLKPWYTEEEFNRYWFLLHNPPTFPDLKAPTKPYYALDEASVKEWSRYHAELYSAERREYAQVAFFKRHIRGAKTYKEYQRQWFKYECSDNGRMHYHIGSKWVNRVCNRPLRRKHKEQIRSALVYEDDYEVVIDPPVKGKSLWLWIL